MQTARCSCVANAASIYGESLVLEKEYGNLGYWSSQDDHAVWTVDVPNAGTFAVWFDWSCANDSAGNTYMLETGLERMTGTVAGTGSWDTYRQAKVGEIVLQAGTQELTLRSLSQTVLRRHDRSSENDQRLVPYEKGK